MADQTIAQLVVSHPAAAFSLTDQIELQQGGATTVGGTLTQLQTLLNTLYDALGVNKLNSALANLTGQGQIISLSYGEALAFGDPVYIKNDGLAYKADAVTNAKIPAIGMCIAAGAGPGNILLRGIARNDAWGALTVGGVVYVASGGSFTQVQPAGANNVIQVVAVALAAKVMLVNVSPDYITHV